MPITKLKKKKNSLRKTHTVCLQLCDILEKAKPKRQ